MPPAVRVDARSLTARGERTRNRLVAAGEEIFGLRGYHDASIAEITQTASVAQGTFYLYFDGKRELLRAVVEERGHELRATLARATAGVTGRVAKEQAGFAAFFAWMARHRALYLIVRQAEYVDGTVYRGWYRQLADGYADALGVAIDDGEIAPVDDVRAHGDRRFRGLAVVGDREAKHSARPCPGDHRPSGGARAGHGYTAAPDQEPALTRSAGLRSTHGPRVT